MSRSIGSLIRDARKRAGMTQGELGSAVGVSAASICETEGDNRKVFSPDLMVAVSDAVHDIRLLQEYCDMCPIRKRIIVRKFRALNNIQGGTHIATLKVNQKLAEAA